MTPTETGSPRNRPAKIVGWLLLAFLALVDIAFSLGFWILPSLTSRQFEFAWDGWASAILLMIMPAAIWAADRDRPSPLRAAGIGSPPDV